MAINTYREFLEHYEQPKIDGIIVGFSGIDPAPLKNETSSAATTRQEVINVMNDLTISIDSGVIT